MFEQSVNGTKWDKTEVRQCQKEKKKKRIESERISLRFQSIVVDNHKRKRGQRNIFETPRRRDRNN